MLRFGVLAVLFVFIIGAETSPLEIRWIEQFKVALEVLPSEIRNTIDINGEGHPRLVFENQPNEWRTGTANRRTSVITINLTPNPSHPFPFEYISENGYTEEEMLWAALHELGHIWSFNVSQEFKRGIDTAFNKGVTRYGCKHYIESCIGVDVVKVENFAEAFALYMIMPNYLKTNFPKDYEWLKENAFNNAEYSFNYNPPSSLLARLTELYS